MEIISFDELGRYDAPFQYINNEWATEEEVEAAKKASIGADTPLAFTRNGSLLVSAKCHGGAGRFPLVCMDGKTAYWDSEVVGPAGKSLFPKAPVTLSGPLKPMRREAGS